MATSRSVKFFSRGVTRNYSGSSYKEKVYENLITSASFGDSRSGGNSKFINGFRRPNPFSASLSTLPMCMGGSYRSYTGGSWSAPGTTRNYAVEGPWYQLTRERTVPVDPENPDPPVLLSAGNMSISINSNDFVQVKERDLAVDFDYLNNVNLARALRQVRSSPIHMGMFLAGLKDTYKMVAGTVNNISKAYSAVRHGRVRDAITILAEAQRKVPPYMVKDKLRKVHDFRPDSADLSKVAANKWLKLQFGWSNLYSDIKGLIEAGPKVLTVDQLPRVTGRAVMFDYKDAEIYTRTDSLSTSFRGISKLTGARNTINIVRVDYNVGNPNLYLSSMLGLVDPLEVLWDKVPYSFVIDWFLPVSTWISSCNASTGLHFLGGSVTNTVDSYYVASRSPIPVWQRYAYTYRVKGSPMTIGIQVHETRRTRYAGSPSPVLWAMCRMPSSMWHLVTSLSLLRQRFH